MQAGLFNFDFSNFLQLQDQLKLSKDRVLIAEISHADKQLQARLNEGWNRQIYLKRFSLEKYIPGEGFKTYEIKDKGHPPTYLAGFNWEKSIQPSLKDHSDIKQTLYLLNIDPSSLLGIESLFKVTPLSSWENSPFKQIYSSYSHAYTEKYDNIINETPLQDNFLKTISKERKKILLNWGENRTSNKVKELAEEITKYFDTPLYKAVVIEDYLQNNYFYSLKPGSSGAKDRIEYFLFDSKKGYCTYYAFSMVLLLRSIGIASRVAVGFTPDMQNHTLNFYDVRVMDGHAWVEVYFDNYGWVTFDPTSSTFPEGEDYTLELGNKDERDNLIDEILDNKDKIKELGLTESILSDVKNNIYKISRSLKTTGFFLLLFSLFTFIIVLTLFKNLYYIKYKFSKDNNQKIIYLYNFIISKLSSLGWHLKKRESIEEYKERIKIENIANIDKITGLYQQALFSNNKPNISVRDLDTLLYNINSDLKKLGFKTKIRSFFNITLPFKKYLFFILLLSISVRTYSQDNLSLRELLKQSQDAIDESYFDTAISALDKASELYPDSYEPYYKKGEFFYDNNMYESALKNFKIAYNKGYFSNLLISYISSCHSKKGRDAEALKIYETNIDKLSRSKYFYSEMGWLYYKVNKVDKGIELLEEGLKKHKDSPSILMQLGTLNSSIKNYNKSRYYYLQAIQKSYGKKDDDFRSIAYYNLSIVEENFLNFEDAIISAKASIALKNRSSAHAQLSYIYLTSLQLKKAYNEIKKTSGLEPITFFPQKALIEVYLASGKPDDAIKISKDLLNADNYEWIENFGVSIKAFHTDIYRLLSTAYKHKTRQAKFTEKTKIIFIKQIYYNFLSLYYNILFANGSIKIGNKTIKGGADIEGLNILHDGLYDIFPSTSSKILKITSEEEVKVNPKKLRIYSMKQAILSNKADKIMENLDNLDEKWDKYLLMLAYENILKNNKRKNKKESIKYSFENFPQVLPISGIRIPAAFNYSASIPVMEKYKISKLLKSISFKQDKNSNIQLNIVKNNNSYNIITKNKTVNFELDREAKYKVFKDFFTVQLD